MPAVEKTWSERQGCEMSCSCFWALSAFDFGVFVRFCLRKCLHLHSKMFQLKMSVFAFHSVVNLCIFVHFTSLLKAARSEAV